MCCPLNESEQEELLREKCNVSTGQSKVSKTKRPERLLFVGFTQGNTGRSFENNQAIESKYLGYQSDALNFSKFQMIAQVYGQR